MDGAVAEVGEVGELVFTVDRRDRDHVVEGVAGRRVELDVVVGRRIAGGRDEQMPGAARCEDGVRQRLVGASTTPTVVGDGDLLLDRVLDAFDGIR